MNKRMMDQKGFTLIELLLVVVVMGLMLAVIVPRGQRATVDSKYTLVRQAAAELASFGNDWVEQQMNAQTETSSTTMDNYLFTLTNTTATAAAWGAGYAAVANTATNWNGTAHEIKGRAPITPENSVAQIVPPEKTPRNPFNGASYFSAVNNVVTPGALNLATVTDGTGSSWHYYALVFYGTDNVAATASQFYAGMGNASDAAKLRNGIFMSRAK